MDDNREGRITLAEHQATLEKVRIITLDEHRAALEKELSDRAAKHAQELKALRKRFTLSYAEVLKHRWAHIPHWCQLINNVRDDLLDFQENSPEEYKKFSILCENLQQVDKHGTVCSEENEDVYMKESATDLISSLVPSGIASWLDERERLQTNRVVCNTVSTDVLKIWT